MWNNPAVLQFELQVALPLLVAMVGLGLTWIKQHLNLQAQSTGAQLANIANDTIQTATANFAGKVANGLTTGTLTQATAVADLTKYLKNTAADSMTLLQPNATAIETMLLGKVADKIGVAGPLAIGPVPIVIVGPGAA